MACVAPAVMVISVPGSYGRWDSEAIVAGYEGFADEFSMILSRQLDRAS